MTYNSAELTWSAERDKKIQARIRELLESDFEKAESNSWRRYRKALAQAAKEIPAKTAHPIEGQQKPLSRVESNARHDAIHALTLELLAEDPELKALAARDEYAAFKAAMHKAKRAGEAALSLTPDGPAAAAIARARQIHKVAMIQLGTDATLRARAAVNYPEGFELSHSAADTYGDDYCFVPSKTDANSFKRDSREERVHRLALELLRDEPSLRELDRYQSEKAFDQAMTEANGHIAMTLKGVEFWSDSFRAKRMGMPVRASMSAEEREEHSERIARAHALVREHAELSRRVDSLEAEIPALEPGDPRMLTQKQVDRLKARRQA